MGRRAHIGFAGLRLSWFGRNRRLAKDYENLAITVLSVVTLATVQFGLRRLARK